jgi:NACHT domain-containing protein
MNLKTLLTKWHLDPLTAVVTIVVAPILYALLKIFAGHLKRFLSYLLEGLLYAANRFLWSSLATSLSLTRYCRLQLSSETRHLFVPSSRDIKLDLDTVFVTLTMDYPGSQKSDYSHQDVLNVGNRLRVIGDPGSGKSSLSKKLFRDACKQGTNAPRHSRLPFLVELKKLQPPKALKPPLAKTWLYDYLFEEAKRSAVYRMDECFTRCVESEGLLVLLDGLDEVALVDYARVYAVIDGLNKTLAEKRDKNIIVLTMRTQFHQQIKQNYRDSFGPALFIKPFTPTDIFEFLTRWPFQTERATNISKIYRQLTDRPSLREMCTNPLILSMYVAEDQTSRDVLSPESRTQFYSKVLEELILKRRLKQTGPQPAPMKLKEQRERILGRICFEHLLDGTEPANCLPWKRGVAITSDILGTTESAEERFRELSKDTGLFTEERTEETFRFIHLTICEQ